MGDGFDNQSKKAFQKVMLGYDVNHWLLIVEVAEGKEIQRRKKNADNLFLA